MKPRSLSWLVSAVSLIHQVRSIVVIQLSIAVKYDFVKEMSMWSRPIEIGCWLNLLLMMTYANDASGWHVSGFDEQYQAVK